MPFVRKLSHDGTRFCWLVARIGFVVLGILASVVMIVDSPRRRLETANGAYNHSKKNSASTAALRRLAKAY